MTSFDTPQDVWQVRFVTALIPSTQRSGLPWDDDEGPDAFLRFFRNDRMLFESEPITDSTEPTWNVTIPDNVWLPAHQSLRIELWDQDGVGEDPIGIWTHTGLPSAALADADVRITLEGGSSLTFRVQAPIAHRGVGIRDYEIRSDALIVLDVIERSPAGRAGIRLGDRIIAVGGNPVSEMTEGRAASALSMSADRRQVLTVLGPDGRQSDVQLDNGYVWLAL